MIETNMTKYSRLNIVIYDFYWNLRQNSVISVKKFLPSQVRPIIMTKTATQI